MTPWLKGRRTRRVGRALPLALAFVMAMGAVALADNLNDTLVAGESGTSATIEEGQTFSQTIDWSIQKTGANNVAFDVTVNFTKDPVGANVNPSWITLSTSSVTFSDYSDIRSLVVSGTAPPGSSGSYQFKVTPASTAGNLTVGGAINFAITVTEPTSPSDTTAPVITITEPGDGDHFILGEVVNADYSCVDNESTVTQCEGTVDNGDPIATSTPGSHTFRVDAASAGGTSYMEHTYYVDYAACGGATSLSILQPINGDGSSVFKQKSTVPAKFRVCDVNGDPVGTAGVVDSFNLVKITNGTTEDGLTEAVDSTVKATSEFRYDPIAGQWIFNMNTKNLAAGKTYWYKITLDSGQTIGFSFGLK